MAKFEGELIHFGSVRGRISGSGTYLTTLSSLDDAASQNLPNITLSITSGIEPTILSDFISQRAYLKGQVVNIDEYFEISKFIVYIRPVGSGLPL